jgi:hypothetical protein
MRTTCTSRHPESLRSGAIRPGSHRSFALGCTGSANSIRKGPTRHQNPLLYQQGNRITIAPIELTASISLERADCCACARAIGPAGSLAEGLVVAANEGAISLHPNFVSHLGIPNAAMVPIADKEATWDLFVVWQRGKTSGPLRALLDLQTRFLKVVSAQKCSPTSSSLLLHRASAALGSSAYARTPSLLTLNCLSSGAIWLTWQFSQ